MGENLNTTYTLLQYVDNAWKPTTEEPLNLKNESKNRALVVGQVQSGKTKFMIEQTEKALESGFDCVIIIGGTNNNLLSQTVKRFNEEFGKDSLITFEIKNSSYDEIPNKKSIITTLKGKDSLVKIHELIRKSDDKKILVFDDESDFGSVNISKHSTSALNEILKNIYDEITLGLFVSVTATPFADILSLDSKDINYMYSIEPNKEYTGSKYFLGSNAYNILDIKKNSKSLQNKQLMKIIIDHIKRVYDSGFKNSQLLLNADLGKTFHSRDWNNITSIISNIRTLPFESFFGNRDNERLTSIIDEMMENTITLNADADINSFNNSVHSIVIGGALVSRGFTFEKLLTTVLINEPNGKQSADTLLQRARWFGYRKSFIEYIKVYVTKEIYESLVESDNLIDTINNLIKHNGSVDEIRKYLMNVKYEKITSTTKRTNNERKNNQ